MPQETLPHSMDVATVRFGCRHRGGAYNVKPGLPWLNLWFDRLMFVCISTEGLIACLL